MQFCPTGLKSSPAWEKQTHKTQKAPWGEEAEEEICISSSWLGGCSWGNTGREDWIPTRPPGSSRWLQEADTRRKVSHSVVTCPRALLAAWIPRALRKNTRFVDRG